MILVVNGPNLDMLGRRQPEIYGTTTLAQLRESLEKAFPGRLAFFQSNAEGAIIDRLHEAFDDPATEGVVINPGALAHTSLAVADAAAMLRVPVVEVHITNIHARAEAVRHTSLLSPACRGVICGLGTEGYRLAVQYLLAHKA